MKLIIASDIHGSYFYTQKLLDRVEEEKADKILLLGDILYHGPRNDLPNIYDTKKTAELLNQYKDKILCVRGNCDADVDQCMLNFNIESSHMILSINDMTIFATHGHRYNTRFLPELSSIDILLHGHTHIPTKQVIDKNKYYINPGSVSIPKGNSSNSYITLDGFLWQWKNLDGEVFDEFNFVKWINEFD